jgi:hypothetical protein
MAAGDEVAQRRVGMDSDAALEIACAFWGELLGVRLEDWAVEVVS